MILLSPESPLLDPFLTKLTFLIKVFNHVIPLFKKSFNDSTYKIKYGAFGLVYKYVISAVTYLSSFISNKHGVTSGDRTAGKNHCQCTKQRMQLLQISPSNQHDTDFISAFISKNAFLKSRNNVSIQAVVQSQALKVKVLCFLHAYIIFLLEIIEIQFIWKTV